MSEHKIMEEARLENDRVSAETIEKIQTLNAAVYRDCVQTVEDMKQAKIKGDNEMADFKERSEIERQELEKQNIAVISNIITEKNLFVLEQLDEIEAAEDELESFKKEERLKTERAKKEEDTRAQEFGLSMQEFQQQQEIYLKLQKENKIAELDTSHVQQIRKINDMEIASVSDADDELRRAREKLEEFKRLQVLQQERIKKAEEEKRKQSFLSKWCPRSPWEKKGKEPQQNTKDDFGLD